MNMKHILAASAAAFIAATAANAADVIQPAPYEPAPVVAVPTFSWTGGYIGVQAGGTWSDANVRTERNFNVNQANQTHITNWDPNADGFVGGLYAGYNFEVGSNIILGAETDFVWDNAKDSRTTLSVYDADNNTNYHTNGNIKQKWAGATRVRVGYAMDRVMPYIAGGVAYTKVSTSGVNYTAQNGTTVPNTNTSFAYSNSNTLTGWTIGAGVDYAVTDNVLVRLEYRYADYGDKTNTYNFNGNQTFKEKVDYKSNDLRVGVAYKF